MQRKIKVGMLVSYDYELLRNSMLPVYEYADKIVLAVDIDGKTWSGNNMHIPDDFWQWIRKFDTQHKIEIYRDSFYVAGLTSIQNDTRERNMLARYMGEGGWHIQVDADEYFIDFKDLVDFLHYLDNKKPHINCVKFQLLTLFKKTPNAFLFAKEESKYFMAATTVPDYIRCRNIKKPRAINYSQRLIHDSWARSEEDLWIKLKNWGHNNDFNTEGYFQYWKAIDEKNYMFARNLHPMVPTYWPSLEIVESSNIQELLEHIRSNKKLLNAEKEKGKIEKIAYLFVPPVFFKLYRKLFRKMS
jgi:hypothetical protein